MLFRLFSLLILIFFILGVGFYILKLPIWNIKEVVVNGAQMLSPEEIRGLAGIPISENLFFTQFTRAQHTLGRIPAIKSFKLYRLPPATVLINIEERKPVAALVFPSKSSIIDVDGYILNGIPNLTLNIPNMEELPVISGIDEKDAVKGERINPKVAELVVDVILKLTKFLEGSRIQLDLGNFENISILLDDLLRVKLGDAGQVKKKMQVFSALLPVVDGKWGEVEYIDIKVPDFPVIKYRN